MNIKRHSAETIYISHPEASYGIFCFNEVGDLFVNSDWGMYGYAWRAYGDNFKDFLSGCDAEYLVGKFSINHREVSGKKMPPYREKNLQILTAAFIDELKAEVQVSDTTKLNQGTKS